MLPERTNYAVPGFSLGAGSPSNLSQWFSGRFLKGRGLWIAPGCSVRRLRGTHSKARRGGRHTVWRADPRVFVAAGV